MALLPPNCFHHRASEYGVEPPMLNCVELPSSDGELWFGVRENVATLPLPPAPAHTVQFSQPGISSIWVLVIALGGTPVLTEPTLTVTGCLYTTPVESQAWTTSRCDPVAAALTVVFRLLELIANTLTSSR